jgi:2-polyprenyl-6-methoxyphenol hydroxylase-like FAD-dependent oxidoreductase
MASHDDRYRVLIVGGGVSGMSLAICLAWQQVAVDLVDWPGLASNRRRAVAQ